MSRHRFTPGAELEALGHVWCKCCWRCTHSAHPSTCQCEVHTQHGCPFRTNRSVWHGLHPNVKLGLMVLALGIVLVTLATL